MSDWYVDSGIAGDTADPVYGADDVYGPDTDTGTGGIDNGDPDNGSITNPCATLTGLATAQFGNILPGDRIFIAGRQRPAADLLGDPYLFLLDGTGGGVEMCQWVGRSQACIDAALMPGGTLANNLTVGAGYWTAATNAFTITCDGSGGTLDLRAASWSPFHGLAGVSFDWYDDANLDSKGRHKAWLKGYCGSSMYKWWGTWASTNMGSGRVGAGTSIFSVGDSVVNGGTTYICIVAHTTSGTFATDLAAGKWETFATEKAALAAATPGAQGKFTFDAQTGELVVLMPTTSGGVSVADPSDGIANGIEVVIANKTAFLFLDTSTTTPHEDSTIHGLRFMRWCDSNAQAPYGNSISFIGSKSCSIHDCIFEDVGDHAWAFGAHVENPLVYGCTIVGGMTGCYFMVFNASGSGNTATGCVARDITVYANSLLAHDGITVDRSGAGVVCYVHGPHSGSQAVRWENITIIHYVPASGLPDNIAPFYSDNSSVPPNNIHARDFTIYVKNCTQTNGVQWGNQGNTSYIGFENCSFHGERVYQVTNGHFIDIRSVTGYWLFEGCEIVADMRNSNGAANAGIFAIGANTTVACTNTSIYDIAASHSNNKYGIVYFSGAGDAIFTGCIMGYRATDRSMRVTIGDGAIDETHHIFSDNQYFNCGYTATSPADVWSENTSFDSESEWISTIDTGDGYLNNAATSPYAIAAGTDLSLTTAAKSQKHAIGNHVARGVNGPAYSRNYGAYQYGGGVLMNPLGVLDLDDD